MKKIFIGIMAMIATLTAFIACEDEIDEVAQWNRVVENSAEILGLKDACDKINYNVSSFTKIVEAQQQNLTITAAYPNENGYLIVFSDGTFAQLLNGKDGADGKDGKDGVDGKDGQDGLNGTNGVDGKDGKDGYVPAIAIKKDVDGIYYWTCDGAFMIDAEGNKVPAQGKDGKDGVDGVNGINGTNGANGLVAQFMVSEAGELQYRYNDTDAWTSLGNVKGADGANGADGINGTNGTNGTNGVDGKTPTFKIVEGNLLVSYDGEKWNDLGTVKGADGVNGTDGANGTNGTNGADGANGTNGKDGANGKDGITPEFKIDGGLWYVSYDNKTTWIELGQATGDKGDKGDTGAKGDKGDAGLNGTNGTNGKDGINGTNGTAGKDGITPKLKIVDGYWYISYDGGKTYETEPLGKATGDKGDKGDKGDAGVAGKTPTFKIEGGVLFVSYDATTWTSLGKISGENGTDGKTPTMKIESGDWYVSYDKGETWTKLGQATGDKGDNGDNGITPTFKVESGNLYVSYNEGTTWTNLGKVKGADGTAGSAGVTPKLKITDGYWYVSYDNEKTWTKLDKATGANGVDGKTPSFKVEGGVLFVSYDATTWTSLGKISGENGNNGVTPKFKITAGDWYVSYDEGETWTKLGQATGDKGDNGDNGITPTFKVESGNLYVSYNSGTSWSLVGIVKGTAGKDGVSPKFKITDGYWYVSYDNEKTWTKLDKATGVDGKDGVSPELSINSEGHLISTVNGVATDLGLGGASGNVIFKYTNDSLAFSSDGGKTWYAVSGAAPFTMPKSSGKVDGYEYVDLGLPSGLKWATMNVGAKEENDYGTYYVWGEIAPAPKNDYSSANCKAYSKSSSSLKTSGVLDANGNLTADYDAATQNWSENWRMPTKAEFDELLNNCTWTWTSLGGVNGYKVASKKAGNTNWIFLPAAGYRNDTSGGLVGSDGFYWSSTVYGSGSYYAYYLRFDSGGKSTSSNYRNYGHTVRPVTE